MKEEEISQIITAQPMFRGLELRYAGILAGCGRVIHYAPGDYLFHEGSPADCLELIQKGRVSLDQNAGSLGDLVIEQLGTGDIVTWSWLIPPHRSWFSARALEPTEVIAFDGRCLRGACESDARFGFELLQCMTRVAADRLVRTRQRLVQECGGRV